MVYVDAVVGNDANDGFSEATAKRTIQAGANLLRNGWPDHLRIKRGQTHTIAAGPVAWKWGGRNASEPLVWESYGPLTDPPPVIDSLATGAILATGGGGTPAYMPFIRIYDLTFVCSARNTLDDTDGVVFLMQIDDFLIEGCSITGYAAQLALDAVFFGANQNVRVRRCTLADSQSGAPNRANGFHSYGCAQLLVDQCFVDRCGRVPGGTPPTTQSHNMYIDLHATVAVAHTITGNVSLEASSHGIQARGGGTVAGNVVVRCPIGILTGTAGTAGGGIDPPFPLTTECSGNVVVQGIDLDALNPRGWGIFVQWISAGNVGGNIVATQGGTGPQGIVIDNTPLAGNHDVKLADNVVYRWGSGFVFEGTLLRMSNMQFNSNAADLIGVACCEHPDGLVGGQFSSSEDNTLFSSLPAGQQCSISGVGVSVAAWKAAIGDTTSVNAPPAFADPGRTIESYMASLGLAATIAEFRARRRAMYRGSWDDRFNAPAIVAYFQAGYAH